MFEVELFGDVTPLFVNPANGVVDQEWRYEPDAQLSNTQSFFSYANGLQVEADSDSVSFKHATSEFEDSLSPHVAKRYAAGFSPDNWYAIALSFIVGLNVPEKTEWHWPVFETQLRREGVKPLFDVHAAYDFPDRSLLVAIIENAPIDLPLHGRMRVYRPLSPRAGSTEHVSVESILDGWRDDLQGAQDVLDNLLDILLRVQNT